MPHPEPEPVRDFAVGPDTTLRELGQAFEHAGGFTAARLAEAADVLRRMLGDEGCVRLLAFPAAPVATGLRGVLRDMVERGAFQALVTTCGTLDHDLARVWAPYLRGSFDLDDAELHRRGLHRLGSVLVPVQNYGPLLEERLRPLLDGLAKRKDRWGPRELLHELGLALEGQPRARDSILFQCARLGIPVFVPGITDGAVGAQLWLLRERHRSFTLDVLQDERELSDLVHGAERLGLLSVGGGISKHHAIWWAQFRGGLDYALYVTTAQEHDGSLSGARTREAISWGKLKEQASHVTVDGEATVLLPLLWGMARQPDIGASTR